MKEELPFFFAFEIDTVSVMVLLWISALCEMESLDVGAPSTLKATELVAATTAGGLLSSIRRMTELNRGVTMPSATFESETVDRERGSTCNS
jgi:hypothetical protein